VPLRERMPWSNDDVSTLSDLLSDGWPLESCAKRLQRSKWAVTAQAGKCGISVMRHGTVAAQLQILPEVDARLGKIARERGVTKNTLMRIIVELATRSPEWLSRLFDDEFAERNADGALPLTPASKVKPKVEPRIEPSPLLVPLTPVLPVTLAAAFAPMLLGSVG
jgi:hypothetical protein